MEKSNSGGAAMSEGERGGVADLIAELAGELGRPPDGCGRAMALVVGLGGADHLGLLAGGRPSPGGLDLLSSVIPSRTRPQATLLLEWVYSGERRRYLGWSVELEATRFIWRRMGAEEGLDDYADDRDRFLHPVLAPPAAGHHMEVVRADERDLPLRARPAGTVAERASHCRFRASSGNVLSNYPHRIAGNASPSI